MPDNPQLHDFDIQPLLDDLGPQLQVIAEYDTETYNELYVADSVVEAVGGTDAYAAQRERIAEFLRLDFLDRHAYGDIVPRAGESELLVTQAANVLLIRVFVDDVGLFVSVERNGAVGELIDTVERAAR